MYGRSVGEQTFTWEPSGGLLNAGLVLRDRETDSWWSIISNESIWGEVEGMALRHLPGSEKATFGEWRAKHPETKVLSVDGVEHLSESPFDRYFDSATGYRDLSATDRRLKDKDILFGFHLGGRAHAIPQARFRGGRRFEVDGRELFLYREAGDSTYRSSVAVEAVSGARFRKRGRSWQVVAEDGRMATFDRRSRRFRGATELVRPIDGFDTFWYIWSLTNPETEVHRR